jgi:5-deoxy-glucuronate isomerase
MTNEWFFPAGSLRQGAWQSVVDDSIEGWQHTGLRVATLGPGDRLELPAGDLERVIVPLAGSFRVELDDGAIELAGRRSVFDGPTDTAYLGLGRRGWLSGAGRVAVAEAPARRAFPVRHVTAAETPVELRGSGRSSRQVHNFGTPDALDADAIIVCEVITPAENWSSYPAHKHDEHRQGTESQLEEIYYFETEVTRGVAAAAGKTTAAEHAAPFGLFATYSSAAGEIDTAAIVRTGDVALVPYGYHGPAAAAPGYDLYYLNVMAGPGDERVWNITDDLAHAWVRETWNGQQIDDRLPYRTTPTNKTTQTTGEQQ